MKRLSLILSALLLAVLVLACTEFNPAAPTDPPPTEVAQADTRRPAPLPPWRQPGRLSRPRPPTRRPPTPAATPSDELLAEMDVIETEMELLRGLDETSPITRSLMTRDELAVRLARDLEEDYTQEEVDADVRVLAAFDFVPEDYDLRGLLVDLYSTQVIGFYDDEEDTLYIIIEAAEEGFDLPARITFAHEYTHGLQDEHFGLDTFIDGEELNDDAYLARLALVEGDASLAMTEFLFLHLDEITAQDLASLQEGGDDGSDKALEAAPAIIRETFLFPYIYGLDFVTVVQEDGWDAVDAAFADPPQSTEQILHPEKYLTRDEPTVVSLPPLTDTLGAGWRLVEAETLGEFQLGLYLEQQVEQDHGRSGHRRLGRRPVRRLCQRRRRGAGLCHGLGQRGGPPGVRGCLRRVRREQVRPAAQPPGPGRTLVGGGGAGGRARLEGHQPPDRPRPGPGDGGEGLAGGPLTALVRQVEPKNPDSERIRVFASRGKINRRPRFPRPQPHRPRATPAGRPRGTAPPGARPRRAAGR